MHWSERVAKILQARTNNLRELAAIGGFDPTTLYTGQSLAGCDLRGQDLRGMNLEGCDLDKAIIDSSTKIEAKFDPRIERSERKIVDISINSDLNAMVQSYMIERKLNRLEVAVDTLISSGFSTLYSNNYHFYSDIVDRNIHITNILNRKPRRVDGIIKVSAFWSEIIDLFEFFKSESTQMIFTRLIMIGLLRKRIRPNSKKDYSNLSPNAFYPPRLIKVEGSLGQRPRK